MHRMAAVACGLFLTIARSAIAQPIPPGMKVGLGTYLQVAYGGVKNDLLEAANLMAADDYGFKPGSAAEMRSFGQLFAHVAEGQFGTCAAIKGAANPVQGKRLEREPTTKADVIKLLSESFAFCDEVFASMTEANALEFVKIGQGEIVRAAVMTGILAHDSEMYGIATVYLRGKNLVPPSTGRHRTASPK